MVHIVKMLHVPQPDTCIGELIEHQGSRSCLELLCGDHLMRFHAQRNKGNCKRMSVA